MNNSYNSWYTAGELSSPQIALSCPSSPEMAAPDSLCSSPLHETTYLPSNSSVTTVNPEQLRNKLMLQLLNLNLSRETNEPTPLDYIQGNTLLIFEVLINCVDILNYEFYVISFGATIGRSGNPMPCEIAVSVFSLSKGETRHFHRFIDPTPLSEG